MAIAFVTEAHNDTAGASTTLNVTLSPTAGNGLIVAVCLDKDAGAPTISSIVTTGGTGSDSFTKITGTAPGALNNGVELWRLYSAGASRTGITITASAALRFGASLIELSHSGALAVGTSSTANGSGQLNQAMTIGGASFVISAWSQNDAGSATADTGTIMANAFLSNQGNVFTTSMRNAGETTQLDWSSSAGWEGAIASFTDAAGGGTVRRRGRRLTGVG